MKKRLGVNIDHVATLRNARGESHPNILKAAQFVMKCGADLITIHLREDRRHIKDADLKTLSKFKYIPINLEMACNIKMLKIALKYNNKTKDSAIKNLTRISKPGLRKYSGVDTMPRVLNGLGIAIVSTSIGLITDKEARKQKVGGEILCYVD